MMDLHHVTLWLMISLLLTQHNEVSGVSTSALSHAQEARSHEGFHSSASLTSQERALMPLPSLHRVVARAQQRAAEHNVQDGLKLIAVRRSARKFMQAASDQDMATLNDQILASRKQIDTLLFQCESARRTAELEIQQIDSKLVQVSAVLNGDVGAQRENAAEVDSGRSQINRMEEELATVRTQCTAQSSGSKRQLWMLQKDEQAVTVMQSISSSCSTIKKTSFLQVGVARGTSSTRGCASAGVFSSSLLGALRRQGKSLASKFAKHALQKALRTSGKRFSPMTRKPSGVRCVSGEVSCGMVAAQLQKMLGRVQDHRVEMASQLEQQDVECAQQQSNMRQQIVTSRRNMAEANQGLSRVMADAAQAGVSRDARNKERKSLVEDITKRRAECERDLHELESEICDGYSIRNALREKKAAGSSKVPIRDCDVSDWSYGDCSQECASTPSQVGSQEVTRTVIIPPEANGVDCPPLEARLPCGNTPCPVDCEMEDWSGWTACSLPCGGGTQSRVRGVKVDSKHDGMACPVAEDRQSCNEGSCDADCELSEWTAWSTCSRGCSYDAESPGGQQFRTKGVKAVQTGAGSCPSEDSAERSEAASCNQQLCPAGITCASDQDIVVLLDASVLGNYTAQIQLAKSLVSRSNESVRFGVVAYAETASVLSSVTGEHSKVLTALGGAKPALGNGNDVAQGEALGRTLLSPADGAPRDSVVLLLTNSDPTRFGPARQAANIVKKSGARVVVGTVSNHGGTTRQQACELASEPCSSNLVSVDAWSDLGVASTRFLTAVCDKLNFPTSA